MSKGAVQDVGDIRRRQGSTTLPGVCRMGGGYVMCGRALQNENERVESGGHRRLYEVDLPCYLTYERGRQTTLI